MRKTISITGGSVLLFLVLAVGLVAAKTANASMLPVEPVQCAPGSPLYFSDACPGGGMIYYTIPSPYAPQAGSVPSGYIDPWAVNYNPLIYQFPNAYSPGFQTPYIVPIPTMPAPIAY